MQPFADNIQSFVADNIQSFFLPPFADYNQFFFADNNNESFFADNAALRRRSKCTGASHCVRGLRCLWHCRRTCIFSCLFSSGLIPFLSFQALFVHQGSSSSGNEPFAHYNFTVDCRILAEAIKVFNFLFFYMMILLYIYIFNLIIIIVVFIMTTSLFKWCGGKFGLSKFRFYHQFCNQFHYVTCQTHSYEHWSGARLGYRQNKVNK